MCRNVTDMTGFSKATAEHGILHFLSFIERKIRVSIPIIEAEDGRLVKTIGDDLFCVFPDATRAAQAAIHIMEAIEDDNRGRPIDEQFSTRWARLWSHAHHRWARLLRR